jgi:hypothetical protein
LLHPSSECNRRDGNLPSLHPEHFQPKRDCSASDNAEKQKDGAFPIIYPEHAGVVLWQMQPWLIR